MLNVLNSYLREWRDVIPQKIVALLAELEEYLVYFGAILCIEKRQNKLKYFVAEVSSFENILEEA